VIRFENVSKFYSVYGKRRVILDRVNFTLRPDVSYGIMGINGAGKSTTLRLLAGVEEPSRGRITRRQRVSWPIGFAGGFNPKMSGRDNVIFVSRIYGEDPRKVLEFVEDFAELGNYINMPTSTYSSGMGARLAFGVSMAIPFDTYLIDEILAVGDARMQKRCKELFAKRRETANVILISHSAEQIRTYCSQAIILVNGQAVVYDKVDEAISAYRRLNG
jgi:capsular polysaccharide transport system ATP-binding protein